MQHPENMLARVHEQFRVVLLAPLGFFRLVQQRDILTPPDAIGPRPYLTLENLRAIHPSLMLSYTIRVFYRPIEMRFLDTTLPP